MKNKLLTLAAVIPLAALLAADTPPKRATLDSCIPDPQRDLGADWFWPWNTPRQFLVSGDPDDKREPPPLPSAEEWKTRFWKDKDPRPELKKQIQDLQAMSDADFKKNLGPLGTVFGYLFRTNVAANADLSGRVLTQSVAQVEVPRSQFITELGTHLTNITGYAYAEFHRARAAAKPAAPDEPSVPDRDVISLRYIVYADDYCQTHPLYSDLTPDTLLKMVQIGGAQGKRDLADREDEGVELAADIDRTRENIANMRRELEEARKALSLTPAQLEAMPNGPGKIQLYAVRAMYTPDRLPAMEQNIASLEKDLAKDEAKLQRISQFQAQVNGAILQNTDGGFLLWQTQSVADTRVISITGRMRRGRVVVEFARASLNSFADAALDDTKRVLNIIAKKLDPFLLDVSPRGDLTLQPFSSSPRRP